MEAPIPVGPSEEIRPVRPTTRIQLRHVTTLVLTLASFILAPLLAFAALTSVTHRVTAAVFACLALLYFVYGVPKLQVYYANPESGSQRFDLENEARRTLVQMIGGLALLAGLYFTSLQVRNTQLLPLVTD